MSIPDAGAARPTTAQRDVMTYHIRFVIRSFRLRRGNPGTVAREQHLIALPRRAFSSADLTC